MRTSPLLLATALFIAAIGVPAFSQTPAATTGTPSVTVPATGVVQPTPSVDASSLSIRLADLATVEGARDNQLTGLGLVTGLAGRGDGASSSLLERVVGNVAASFGVEVPEKEIKSRNCAVVLVTADIGPFARPGERLAVSVSSIGDATDLTGGVVLQTNLKAANGGVYAVAQGPLSETSDNRVKTVGTIPGGAIVEQAVPSKFVDNNQVAILLRDPNFVNASEAESAIAKAFPTATTHAVDAAEIDVSLPPDRTGDPVGFVAALEALTIHPDLSGKVVVNPRTGIVVVGPDVRLGDVAVSYKDTSVTIGADMTSPYLGGGQSKNPFALGQSASVEDLVKVLQDAGVNGDTLIEILKAIDEAGALYGTLVIM